MIPFLTGAPHIAGLLMGADSSLGRFSIIMAVLVAILTVLSMLGKGIWTVTHAVVEQLEATKENTKAIQNLSRRMEKVEQKV